VLRKIFDSFKSIQDAVEAGGAVVSERSGKTHLMQILEMLRFRTAGFSPDDYYTLRLFRSGTHVDERLLNQKTFSRIRQRLNPHQTGVVPFNKWVFCIYFEQLGVPVPFCHAIYHRTRGVDRHALPVRSKDDVCNLLTGLKRGVVIKPLDASHGQGVMILASIDAERREVRRASGKVQSLDDLVTSLDLHKDGWVIQDRIVQHATLAELNASSTNTIRMITLSDASGEVSVIGAVLRIGVGNSEIDNTTGGGIVAPIDIHSGVLGTARSRLRASEHQRHPDSGAAIAGLCLPLWREAQDVVIRAHRLLPFPRTLGWDVAISPTGPVLLEVNSDYYYNHLQLDGPTAATECLRSCR
jgi:hypothetical protein